MKRFLIAAGISLLVITFSDCKQSGKIAQTSETRVARFKMGVFKEIGNPKSGLPLALEKGEVVTLEKIESFKPAQGAPVEYALIKIAGGQTGYVPASYLAKAAIVLTGSAKLYQRPSITSGIARGADKLKPGVVAFLENEDFSDGEWLEIVGGSNAANYFKGWVKGSGSISRDTELVTAAVRLEQALEIYNNPKASDKAKEEARSTLDDIQKNSPDPIRQLAAEALGAHSPDKPATPTEEKEEGIQPLQPAEEPKPNG
ncbi:MAG: lipoprotein LenA [Leptospirales bacterium]|nr:lipoprotein LenA [Leptospirales bacterium]